MKGPTLKDVAVYLSGCGGRAVRAHSLDIEYTRIGPCPRCPFCLFVDRRISEYNTKGGIDCCPHCNALFVFDERGNTAWQWDSAEPPSPVKAPASQWPKEFVWNLEDGTTITLRECRNSKALYVRCDKTLAIEMRGGSNALIIEGVDE